MICALIVLKAVLDVKFLPIYAIEMVYKIFQIIYI